MSDIQESLRVAGFDGNWTIAPATEGSSGRTFIARRPDCDLVVKLGNQNVAGGCLGKLGVTPPRLAQGTYQGVPFSVYPLVAADLPEPAWFGDNLRQVMDLVATYQQDDQLANLLGRGPAGTLRAHLDTEIESVTADLRKATHAAFRGRDVEAAIDRLTPTFPIETNAGLVPSHTDPNNSNSLVSAGRLYLIDWDGITLSDPLRDIGLILWWYVPEDRWPEAFAHLGMPETVWAGALPRLSWWAAMTSLEVALKIDRHAPNDEAVTSFLDDFLHAAHGLSNPKRRAPLPAADGPRPTGTRGGGIE